MEPKCDNTIKWKSCTLVCNRVQHKIGSCYDIKTDSWFSKNLAGDYVVISRAVPKVKVPRKTTAPYLRIEKTKVELLRDIMEGNVIVCVTHGVKSPYYNTRKERYIRQEAVDVLLKHGFAGKTTTHIFIVMKGVEVLRSRRALAKKIEKRQRAAS